MLRILRICRVSFTFQINPVCVCVCVYMCVCCVCIWSLSPCISPVRLCRTVSERGISCNNWTTETQSAAAEAKAEPAAKEIANAREAVKYVYKELYKYMHIHKHRGKHIVYMWRSVLYVVNVFHSFFLLLLRCQSPCNVRAISELPLLLLLLPLLCIFSILFFLFYNFCSLLLFYARCCYKDIHLERTAAFSCKKTKRIKKYSWICAMPCRQLWAMGDGRWAMEWMRAEWVPCKEDEARVLLGFSAADWFSFIRFAHVSDFYCTFLAAAISFRTNMYIRIGM